MDEQPLPAAIADPHKLFNHATWQQCYVDFLRAVYERRRSTGTIKTYESRLKRFFVDPAKTPNKYTRHDVEAFIRAGNVNPHTQNNRLTPIQSFIKFARSYGVEFRGKTVPLFSGIDPTQGIVRAETATDRRAFEEHEVVLFFQAAKHETVFDKRDYALFLCYFSTGRRLSEIKNMRWEDLHPDPSLPSGMAYRWKGKARVEKSKFVELQLPAWNAIQDYLIASKRLESMKPESAVFVSKKSQFAERPMSSCQIQRLFVKIALAAGLRTELTRDLTTHSFRYTYAIELYDQNGHDILAVQKDLDHRGINTTGLYLEKRRKPIANPAAAGIMGKYGFK